MELSASLDVVGIVLSLLIIVTGYMVSSYKQYRLLRGIDNKLILLLKELGNKKGKTDDTSNT